jgi:hypothetical protein
MELYNTTPANVRIARDYFVGLAEDGKLAVHARVKGIVKE